MSHPYNVSPTIEPGDTAEDDPMDDRVFCRECDKARDTNKMGECRICGSKIRKGRS